MGDETFVDCKNVTTLESYGASLISGMVSIRTLEGFHISAYKAGLFLEEEEECSKTICFELRRLMALYKKQFEMISDRAEIDEKSVIEELTKLVIKQGNNQK